MMDGQKNIKLDYTKSHPTRSWPSKENIFSYTSLSREICFGNLQPLLGKHRSILLRSAYPAYSAVCPTLLHETALKSIDIWHVHHEYITGFVVNEMNPVQEILALIRSALHKLDSFRNISQCLPTQERPVRRSMHKGQTTWKT